MSKKRTFLSIAAVAVLAAVGGLTSSAHAEDDLVRVSDAASPRVSYAVEKHGGTLVVLLAVETLSPQQENGGVNVRLGAAADKTVFLTGETPEMDTADGIVRFAFRIPAERLVDSDRGWARLRLAFAVEWDGGPFGQPRQRETFLQSKTRATHAGLSSSPADWQPLNLDESARAAADRRLGIGFIFTQPCDGKATIVVEDAQGKRVRNLVSGVDMDKGPQRIAWDGCDDQGGMPDTHSMPGGTMWHNQYWISWLCLMCLLGLSGCFGENERTGVPLLPSRFKTQGGVESSPFQTQQTVVPANAQTALRVAEA